MDPASTRSWWPQPNSDGSNILLCSTSKKNRINRQSRGCMMQRTKTIHNLRCRWKSHDYLWIDISHAPVVEHPWHWLDVTAWHTGSCGYGSKLAWGLGMPHFQTKPYEMDIVDTKYVASRSEIWQWNILHISSGFFSGIKTPCMQGFSMFDYDGGSKHDLWLFILAMWGANLEPYEALVAQGIVSMVRDPRRVWAKQGGS